MSEKRENELKARLLSRLRKVHPEWVIFPHQDVRQSGIPDFSVTGNGVTSWWEVKHGTPNFVSRKIQEITCQMLDAQGKCSYIAFVEDVDETDVIAVNTKEIQILSPTRLRSGVGQTRASFEGFDYAAVVKYIEWTHGI